MTKIFFLPLCLAVFASCGPRNSDSGNPSERSGREYSLRQGTGTLSIQPSIKTSKSVTRNLRLGFLEKDGAVNCEYNSRTDYAWIQFGAFRGKNRSAPITGLSVTVPNIKEGGDILSSEVFFNVDNGATAVTSDGPISAPTCRILTNGIMNKKAEGLILCTDNIDRADWGRAQIEANFSCPIN